MADLETVKICRRFGGLVAVNDVSFGLQRGEILGVIGPNGAGKTTFINLVSGVYPPTSGSIHFKGRDITLMPAHERARVGIARTFQIIHPVENLDVLENVMLGFIFSRRQSQREARRQAEELCVRLWVSAGFPAKSPRSRCWRRRRWRSPMRWPTSPRFFSSTRSWQG